jgi:hypothetical protein
LPRDTTKRRRRLDCVNPADHLERWAAGPEDAGVFWDVFVSETSVGLFTLWLFTRGKWKTVKV